MAAYDWFASTAAAAIAKVVVVYRLPPKNIYLVGYEEGMKYRGNNIVRTKMQRWVPIICTLALCALIPCAQAEDKTIWSVESFSPDDYKSGIGFVVYQIKDDVVVMANFDCSCGFESMAYSVCR